MFPLVKIMFPLIEIVFSLLQKIVLHVQFCVSTGENDVLVTGKKIYHRKIYRLPILGNIFSLLEKIVFAAKSVSFH